MCTERKASGEYVIACFMFATMPFEASGKAQPRFADDILTLFGKLMILQYWINHSVRKF